MTIIGTHTHTHIQFSSASITNTPLFVVVWLSHADAQTREYIFASEYVDEKPLECP